MKPDTKAAGPLSSLGGRKFSGGVALGALTIVLDLVAGESLGRETVWALVALYGIFALSDALITSAYAWSDDGSRRKGDE